MARATKLGGSELLVGKALGRRDRALRSVKLGALLGPDSSDLGHDARPAALKNFLAHSLPRLGVDCIDICRPVRLDPDVPIEDRVGAIAGLVSIAPTLGARTRTQLADALSSLDTSDIATRQPGDRCCSPAGAARRGHSRHPSMAGICVDVQDPRAVDAFTRQVRERFPRLNVLLNNAGIARGPEHLAGAFDLSVASAVIQTNIVGVPHVTAGLLPVRGWEMRMRRETGGGTRRCINESGCREGSCATLHRWPT